MNERIKELAKQTTKELIGMSPYRARWQEKFAELLVKECAHIAAKNQAENMDWNISEIIKEHFGVKE